MEKDGFVCDAAKSTHYINTLFNHGHYWMNYQDVNVECHSSRSSVTNVVSEITYNKSDFADLETEYGIPYSDVKRIVLFWLSPNSICDASVTSNI